MIREKMGWAVAVVCLFAAWGGAVSQTETNLFVLDTRWFDSVLVASPSTLDFGQVPAGTVPPDQSFTVRNNGTGTLTGSVSVSAPYSIAVGSSLNLASGAQQTVTVRFSPTAEGQYTRSVSFSCGGQTLTRTVSGTALNGTPDQGEVYGQVTGAIPAGSSGFLASSSSPTPIIGQFVYAKDLADASAPAQLDVTKAPGGNYRLKLSPGPKRILTGGFSISSNSSPLLFGMQSVDVNVMANSTPMLVNFNLPAVPDSAHKDIPVVLVRGFWVADQDWTGGESRYWQQMRDALANFTEVWECNRPEDGILNRYHQQGHFIDGTSSIYDNAQSLDLYLRQKVQKYASAHGNTLPPRIHFVGHSMGGLIIRDYIARFRATLPCPIGNVIMLGTPNAGSPLPELGFFPAELGSVLFPSVKNLSQTHMVQTFNPNHYWPACLGAALFRLGGTAPSGAAYSWPGGKMPMTNDGVVPLESVKGDYYPINWQTGSSQTAGSTPQAFIPALGELKPSFSGPGGVESVALNHSELKGSSLAMNWAVNILLGQPQSISNAVRKVVESASAAQSKVPSLPMIDRAVGSVSADGENLVLFPSDAESTLTLLLQWDNTGVGLRLRNPSGTDIDPSVGGHPDISYLEYRGTEPTTGGVILCDIANPEKGVWAARVLGSTVPLSVNRYSLMVQGDGPVVLGPVTEPFFARGQGPLLACSLMSNAQAASEPVTGAAVQAVVTAPDASVNTVVLYDDGAHSDGGANDGVYAAALPETTPPGNYSVRYAADGLGAGTPNTFWRVADGSFEVSSGRGFLAGNLTHGNVDLEGDGVPDLLKLEFWVTTAGGGSFSASAELVDAAGQQRIGASQAIERGGSGTAGATLFFDWRETSQPQTSGPWRIENLQLFQQTGTSLEWLDRWRGQYPAVDIPLPGFSLMQSDEFTTKCEDTTGQTGWNRFGFYTSGLALSAWTANNGGALGARVWSDPTRFRVAGHLANQPEWLPYSQVGSGNFVRVKYYVWAGGQTGPAANQIPNLRLRAQTRFGVNSMLEVLHHSNGDPSGSEYAAEFRPSTDPSRPSLYRVDFDPVDVPYLAENPHTEGIARAYEAYATDPQDNGVICMKESVIGVYPAVLLDDSRANPAGTKIYAVSASDAGDLKTFNSAAEVSIKNIEFSPELGVFASTTSVLPKGSYSEGAFGVTLDTSAVAPAPVCGIVSREFYPGSTPASLIRVEEGKQYKIRWHLTSTQASNRQAQARLRARTCKFAWTQKYEIGGAWATGGTLLSANNVIAQQALPGLGCANPDRAGLESDVNGGWYTMLVHSPLSPEIRAEKPGVPLSVSMPKLTSCPGPGSADSANGYRDLKVACDLVDTLSSGANAGLEQGSFTVDRIEVRTYDLVDDGGY